MFQRAAIEKLRSDHTIEETNSPDRLCRALHFDGRHSGHETTLEKVVRVRGLVVTVQLAPQEVFPEALRTSGGARMARSCSLWT